MTGIHIRVAILSGGRVVTDFGVYELTDGETVSSLEQLRDILAKQYRRWDEGHWGRCGWGSISREEFEQIADANEQRLRARPIKPDGDPKSLLGSGL